MNDGFSLLRQKIRYSAGYNTDYFILATLLKSCAANSDIELGKTIHGNVAAMTQSHGILFYLGFQGPGFMTVR